MMQRTTRCSMKDLLLLVAFVLVTPWTGGGGGGLVEGCNICGVGGVIQSNNTIITITDAKGGTRKVSCARAQFVVDQGGNLFPNNNNTFCNSIVKVARTPCNCTKSTTTTTPAPSPAVTTPAPQTSVPTVPVFVTTVAPTPPTATSVVVTMSPTTSVATMVSTNRVTTMMPTMMATNATTPTTPTTPAPTMMTTPATTTTAPSTTKVSMMPSAAPSMMPTVMPSAMPSMSPTVLTKGNMTHGNKTGAPTGSPTVVHSESPGNPTTCAGLCTKYSSLEDINVTITNIFQLGRVCVCPGNYSDNCPATANVPTLVIDEAQQITIECVNANASSTEMCIFGCPQVTVHVKSGGRLTMLGNDLLELTGGTAYSRLTVEPEGWVNLTAVSFVNTACTTASTTHKRKNKRARKGRKLTEFADGNGGAIKNYGTMYLYDVEFDKCTALYDGGAVWSGNGSSLSIYSSNFTNNVAGGDGGAIYASGTVLYIRETLFSDNSAKGGDANVGGPTQVTGCGNDGIPTFSCNVNQGTSDATTFTMMGAGSLSSLLSLAVALLVPVGVLLL